jgi:DNA gyrase/topoisomerase IV subunit A
MTIIKKEFNVIKEKHATPRTQIVPDEGEIAIEDLIANEGVIITITHTASSSARTCPATARSGAAARASSA